MEKEHDEATVTSKAVQEMVNSLMIKGGPTMCLFIAHSIHAMSKIVLEHKDEVRLPEGFSVEAWIKAAECIQDCLEMIAHDSSE